MEATLSLKLTFGSDLRRFSVARNISFSELRSFIEKHLGLSHLIIKYIDDEEELVTIGSSIELEEAKRLQPDVLRLTVLESKDSQKVPLATSQDKVGGLNACLVRDVTIADGSQITVNTPFTKIWRLKNNGDADWPDNVRLVLVGPENYKLGGSASGVSVRAVKVGQEVDISIDLLAPKVAGRYVGYWRLHNAVEPFGARIWVDVVVVASKADEEEAKRKEVEAEAKRRAEEEEARKKAEEEEAARKKAEEEEAARKKAAEEEAARKKAEEEEAARKKAEDEAIKAAEEAKKKAEEDARKRAEEEAAARKKAEEEAKKAAEEARKAEEEARKKAEEEARKKAEEEAAARKKAEEEARKKAEEEAEAKRRAEEEAKKFVFAEQLAQLVEMGFTDIPKNKDLLIRHNGNIDQALEALFLA